MTTTANITDQLTLGAYAIVGVGDALVEDARDLFLRRNQIPAELRSHLDKTVEELRGRVNAQRTEARDTLQSYADRGETVIGKLRGELDEAADALADDAREAADLVADGARKAAATVATETRSRAQLAKKSKAELYDLASDLDLDGRSTMSKSELVDALSA